MSDRTTTFAAAGIVVTVQLALFIWLKSDIDALGTRFDHLTSRIAAVERDVAFVKGQLSLALPALAAAAENAGNE